MGSMSKIYPGKTNSIDESRDRRKNYKRLPYTYKAAACDEHEADWLVKYKKYPGSTFEDVNSDIARNRNASRGKSTL